MRNPVDTGIDLTHGLLAIVRLPLDGVGEGVAEVQLAPLAPLLLVALDHARLVADAAGNDLGHTVGHAIEKCSGYAIPHGHAVAAGLAVMARASERLGWAEPGVSARIAACLEKNGLPTGTDYPAEALAKAALADKKRSGDSITIVVPKAIGDCELKRISVTELLPIIAAGLGD